MNQCEVRLFNTCKTHSKHLKGRSSYFKILLIHFNFFSKYDRVRAVLYKLKVSGGFFHRHKSNKQKHL